MGFELRLNTGLVRHGGIGEKTWYLPTNEVRLLSSVHKGYEIKETCLI